MIGTDEFVKIGKQAVYELAKASLDPTDNVDFSINDVYFVMTAFVLGSIKGTFSTTLPDGKYYEVTYNADKDEMYVDTYMRVMNTTYKHVESENGSFYIQK